jgi:hypothetical protein
LASRSRLRTMGLVYHSRGTRPSWTSWWSLLGEAHLVRSPKRLGKTSLRCDSAMQRRYGASGQTRSLGRRHDGRHDGLLIVVRQWAGSQTFPRFGGLSEGVRFGRGSVTERERVCVALAAGHNKAPTTVSTTHTRHTTTSLRSAQAVGAVHTGACASGRNISVVSECTNWNLSWAELSRALRTARGSPCIKEKRGGGHWAALVRVRSWGCALGGSMDTVKRARSR